MVLQPSIEQQSQRIQVDMEVQPAGRCVKIRVERFDERLGWYTSGSLDLPLHQLPLLEQAVAEMRTQQADAGSLSDKIIPFPDLVQHG